MIYALWNGELLNADDNAQTEEIETKIRIASTYKELRCKDPNCTTPVVCYKRCAKRETHSSHINKEMGTEGTGERITHIIYNGMLSIEFVWVLTKHAGIR